MAQLENYTKIAIWGMGTEGNATYKFLKNQGFLHHITMLDSHPVDESIKIDPYDVIITGKNVVESIADGQFDLIIKSPGISLYRPEVKAAQEKGTIFTSATNLWFEQYPDAKTLIITGTKGKSTTATLIHHLLKSTGKDTVLAGNIGNPLITEEPAKDLTIIELSSYQIADLKHAPTYALLLNLFPEHINWHLSHDQYFKDKISLLTQSEGQTNIIAADNKTLREYYKSRSTDITFSKQDIANYDCPLQGDHNQLNIAAALKTLGIIGFDLTNITPHLKTYEPLPHRHENCGTVNGLTYINDSISTIPEATIEAIKIHKDTPITLVMGGQDRNQDYAQFVDFTKDVKNLTIITLPDNGNKIIAALVAQNSPVKTHPCHTLKEALEIANSITPKPGTVLLSPAAPSYPHFKNFEDRGNQFKSLINI